jgi:hypothetical protein
MATLQRTVPVPQHEIIMHRVLRWQVFWQGAPLAADLQNTENPVHHLAHIHLTPSAASLGRWNQWPDQRPLCIAQIAGIASALALVKTTVLVRLHWPLLLRESVAKTELQTILPNQLLSGWTLIRSFM